MSGHMPQLLTVDAWKVATERTNESLADELGISTRSLIRYMNQDRPWPFAIVSKLKKLSRGQLTDESFQKGRAVV